MTRREQRIERFCQETKNISKTTTVLLWIFGLSTLGLLIASFVVPPTGVIDPTVLKGAAVLFAFATLAEAREAIREGLGVRLTHGQTTIEVHDLDGKPEQGHHVINNDVDAHHVHVVDEESDDLEESEVDTEE